jgi:hypothetical protein
MSSRKKRAITLLELIVAITLLGVVILAGITIELAMRRMNVKPRLESKLLDELIPIVEMMKKDFEFYLVGSITDPGIATLGTSGVALRVGNIYNFTWHAYNWTGTTGANAYEFWYYPNYFFSSSYSRIGSKVISNFSYSIGDTNTSLSVKIGAISNPGAAVPLPDILTNPSVSLNTTFYTRTLSAL